MRHLKVYIIEKLNIGKSNVRGYNYFPRTDRELKELVNKLIEERGKNANLNDIDVSNITDMSMLFYDSEFNGDISKWDVSNVTEMNEMFSGSKFNGDISEWDVSNVEDMRLMFCGSIFNGDISVWDVSNVENMNGMFYLSKFNGDISKWDVSNVTNMAEMFYRSNFNSDISKWNVSNVINMTRMFCLSKFNDDISEWDVSNVESMEEMFEESPFEGNISAWNVKGNCITKNMFLKCPLARRKPAWFNKPNINSSFNDLYEFLSNHKSAKFMNSKSKFSDDFVKKFSDYRYEFMNCGFSQWSGYDYYFPMKIYHGSSLLFWLTLNLDKDSKRIKLLNDSSQHRTYGKQEELEKFLAAFGFKDCGLNDKRGNPIYELKYEENDFDKMGFLK